LIIVRINVLGVVAVTDGPSSVGGAALGGRRAHIALVALALAGRPMPADELAALIWGDELPSTWDVAVRGVIRGLRRACAAIGGGEQGLVTTVVSGYCLGDGVQVDVIESQALTRRATRLLAEGRFAAAAELAEPVTRLRGEQLLPGEHGDWLVAHRRIVEATALRALQLVVQAASELGDHARAVEAAEQAVAAQPLDEGTHRALIGALTAAGDRAGAVRAYEQCRAALAEQLGIDPSNDTVQVYLAALRDQSASAGLTTARVPSSTSTFLGREAEQLQLSDTLAVPGLVSLTGWGGVGKSRIAARVAGDRSSAAATFAGGRLWVPLSAVGQDALVASAVALELGVSLATDDNELAVAEHLAPLGRVLLVLDGCEPVIDGVASLVAVLLARAPMLTVLVTSRQPLGIDGERTIRIEPMPAPSSALSSAPPALSSASSSAPPGDELADSLQVRLLIDRVREAGGELTIDPRIAPHVVALCQRCGGLPLALELVAAQLAAMPPGDLIDHLSAVAVEGEDRLRAVARSSYALLDTDEAALFRQFGVLDGPVGLPFVRLMVAGTSVAPVRVVRILRELSVRGMVTVDRGGAHWRYQQDDDLHRLARELVVQSGDEAAAFDRVADAIGSLLPDDARASPIPYQQSVTDVLGTLRSLFGAAIDGRADRDRCLELAFRLHRYFATTNVAEGRFWLSRLLAEGGHGEWASYATYALGYLNYWSGNVDDAVRELADVVEMFDAANTPYLSRALIYLAGMLDDLDRGSEAIEYLGRAVLAAAPFDVDLQVAAAMGMGCILAERGDPQAARYAHDAIALGRRGVADQLALALPTAAMVCWQVGAIEDARGYAAEARELLGETRRIARVVMLSVAAGIAFADHDLDRAIEYGRIADSEATDLGVEREMPLIRSVLARSLLERGDLDGAADRAAAAVRAAAGLAYPSQLITCLETAALVAAALGAAPDELAGLLATAAAIRARGERLAFPTLRPAVAELRDRIGRVAEPVTAAAAAAAAVALLTDPAAIGHTSTAGPDSLSRPL
jgi:predicted ATPase/DNA-binding SARP family transcriptional activator